MQETVLLTCAKGIAPVLAAEVLALGLPVLAEETALVETRADLAGQVRLLLHLRSAHRVLVPVADVRAPHPNHLYDTLVEVPWEQHLGPDAYLRVHGHVDTPFIRDQRFAFLKVKDAVMDRLRSVYRRRPDSGPDDQGASLYLHWVGDHARVCLDLAGAPLSRRGYRPAGGQAPLQEALAAAMLLAGGWDPSTPLANPMCGSGTLAIEAALLARNQAPGLSRGNFGLFHLKRFDPALWRREVRAAQDAIRHDLPSPPIVASDSDPAVLDIARENAARAGVAEHIQFQHCDFRDTTLPPGPAWIALNPPYGLRMNEDADLGALYAGIGTWLKGLNTGGHALVITGNLPLAKRFGLKLTSRHTLYNGPVECRLLKFPLFRDSEAASPALSDPRNP